jgi:hypothetical protein
MIVGSTNKALSRTHHGINLKKDEFGRRNLMGMTPGMWQVRIDARSTCDGHETVTHTGQEKTAEVLVGPVLAQRSDNSKEFVCFSSINIDKESRVEILWARENWRNYLISRCRISVTCLLLQAKDDNAQNRRSFTPAASFQSASPPRFDLYSQIYIAPRSRTVNIKSSNGMPFSRRPSTSSRVLNLTREPLDFCRKD